MALSQTEADALLQMPKEFAETDPVEFSRTQPMRSERTLLSLDRREQFILDLERGRRIRARLKYQTRGRKVIVLARLEINGPAHRNPPGAPYRPGERFDGPHFHRYTEGYEDRVAYHLADVPGLNVRDINNGVFCLEDFLSYCRVQYLPNIQLTV